MPRRTIGLLLMAFGTPRNNDQIEPFLTHIRNGAKPSEASVQHLKKRYRAIGGNSPLAAITEAQGAGLAKALSNRYDNITFKIHIGYKHAKPFIEDAVVAMHDEGIARALSLVLAPHYSTLSVRAYNDRAVKSAASLDWPVVATTSSWHTQPKLVRYWATQIEAALSAIPKAKRPETIVVFSAHSLPQSILSTGDPYLEQVKESARLVAEEAKLGHYALGWQSAGRSSGPWIGPDIRDLTRDLWNTAGYRTFIYCPIGFVADHLEVLYDGDIECRAVVDELGGTYMRVAMPNAHPMLIGSLCDVVAGQLTGQVGMNS